MNPKAGDDRDTRRTVKHRAADRQRERRFQPDEQESAVVRPLFGTEPNREDVLRALRGRI
jgi:hypothetical protein